MIVLTCWLVLAISVVFVVSWRKGRIANTNRNAYFFNAVKVHALLGREDAKVAALAAAKAASQVERVALLDYLNRRASDLLLDSKAEPATPNPMVVVERLLRLKDEIETRSTPSADPIQEEAWLSDHNREYLHALHRADPTVFVRQHPDLFTAGTHGSTTLKT